MLSESVALPPCAEGLAEAAWSQSSELRRTWEPASIVAAEGREYTDRCERIGDMHPKGGGVDQAEGAEERAELGVILGYELLLPPERLSDAEIDAQTLADIGVVRRCTAGRPDSVDSAPGAVCSHLPLEDTRHRTQSSTMPWTAGAPRRGRRASLNADGVTETRPAELFRAWAEGAYTPRRLSAALHRSGHARTKAARFLNNFETRRLEGPHA